MRLWMLGLWVFTYLCVGQMTSRTVVPRKLGMMAGKGLVISMLLLAGSFYTEAGNPWAMEQRYVPIWSMAAVCLYWPVAGLFYRWVRDDVSEAMRRRVWIGLIVLCVVVGSLSMVIERTRILEKPPISPSPGMPAR